MQGEKTKTITGRQTRGKDNDQFASRRRRPPTVYDDRREAIRSLYLESLQLVERLHRRLLDVIKDEFDRNGRSDINAIQALLLFNIGNSELTAGELRSRGYYLGSNVSYNLKKLVDLGFINHQRSRIDRRSVRVSLTPKGHGVAEVVAGLYERHIGSIEQVGGINHRRVPADEPRAAAPRPLLERHHRLPHVRSLLRPGSEAAQTGVTRHVNATSPKTYQDVARDRPPWCSQPSPEPSAAYSWTPDALAERRPRSMRFPCMVGDIG